MKNLHQSASFIAKLAALASLAAPVGIAHAQESSTKPQYGAWGFDMAGADTNVKPGDDFFRYANGTWLKRTKIPPDKSAYTLRVAMSDLTEQRIHDLLQSAAASVAHQPTTLNGKVGAFYRSFMDEARAEKLGATPIAPLLDEVRKADTRAKLSALMGRNVSDFFGSIFGVGIDTDLKDPSKYAVYAGQSGLSLPDRDYYLKSSFASQKAKFQSYVAKLLKLENWPEPQARAKDVVDFQAKIAEASWSKEQQRNIGAIYNPMSVAELSALTPGFDWHGYLANAGLGDVQRVIVAEKSAFPRIAAVYTATPVATIQAYLAFTIADNSAPYLSSSFATASFEMRDSTLSGQQAQTVRWKRGVRAVSGGDYLAGARFDSFGNLGWAVGQLYTAKYFPPASKAKIESLVVNLKAAFHTRIDKLDWMSPATKKEALLKLDTYTIKVGYPDHPRDYSSVVILDNDLVGNVRRAAAADWHFHVARRNGPVDRADWGMTPQTNDAYNGSLRDIVFPAGILQPPIFDANADPAMNYGAAGAVIGHELTHGFDDEGRKIDSKGALRDWWTPKDAATFEARARKLGAQYSALEPLPGIHINGQLTMGENIADAGGLTLALDAYRASLHGKKAPVLNGFTGDQRVFLGWAQAWRGKLRDDAVRRQVVSDPHSPRAARVNGPARNIDDWYTLFNVKPGDSLYVAPADRVHIW